MPRKAGDRHGPQAWAASLGESGAGLGQVEQVSVQSVPSSPATPRLPLQSAQGNGLAQRKPATCLTDRLRLFLPFRPPLLF